MIEAQRGTTKPIGIPHTKTINMCGCHSEAFVSFFEEWGERVGAATKIECEAVKAILGESNIVVTTEPAVYVNGEMVMRNPVAAGIEDEKLRIFKGNQGTEEEFVDIYPQ